MLLVPTDAVTYDGGLTYLYTVTFEDDEDTQDAAVSSDNRQATVHKIQVETGLSDGQQTEIISGISDTDQVVVSWTAQLYEGAQVQVLPGED